MSSGSPGQPDLNWFDFVWIWYFFFKQNQTNPIKHDQFGFCFTPNPNPNQTKSTYFCPYSASSNVIHWLHVTLLQLHAPAASLFPSMKPLPPVLASNTTSSSQALHYLKSETWPCNWIFLATIFISATHLLASISWPPFEILPSLSLSLSIKTHHPRDRKLVSFWASIGHGGGTSMDY